MMLRRRALALVAGAAAWRPFGLSAQAAASDLRPRLLAWGSQGLWAAHDGVERPATISGDPLAPIAPQAHAGGVVAVDANGRVRAWRVDAAGAWRAAWSLGFDASVHALVTSEGGDWTLAAHGHVLSLVDAAGRVQRRYEGEGTASALRHHAGRRSFVAAWPALGALWEIQLDPAAPPVFEGLVHDYRMGEAIATPGHLAVRRAPLGAPVPTLAFCDPRAPWVAGMAAGQVVVVHLDVRRRIAAWPWAAARPESAALRRDDGPPQWWLPVGDAVQVIDASRWQLTARHALPGTVYSVFSLAGGIWAWLDHAVPLHAWMQGRWQPVSDAPPSLSAVVADPDGIGLYGAAGTPRQLRRLDAAGRSVQAWSLPADAVVSGLAVFPG